MLWISRGDRHSSAEKKQMASVDASSPGPAFLLPGRYVCKAHLCVLTAPELKEISFEGSPPAALTFSMQGQVLRPRQRHSGCLQHWLGSSRCRHLTQCLACHYLEMEIRGCPTLQQILFPSLPLESCRKSLLSCRHLPWRHRVCTGRALTLGRTFPS